MAKTYKVTLGPKAYSFTDQSTGISIAKGQIKELTQRQYNTVRVRRALQSNHLVMVVEENDATKYTEENLKKMIKRLTAQHKQGMEATKAAPNYSLEEAVLLAKEFDIEPEKGDTVLDIIKAIFESLDEEAAKH